MKRSSLYSYDVRHPTLGMKDISLFPYTLASQYFKVLEETSDIAYGFAV